MKRYFSWILTAALLISMLSVAGWTVSAALRRGDVDANGQVGTSDVRTLLGLIVNDTAMSAAQKEAADFNNDGKVNTADAKAILVYAMNGGNSVATTVDLLAPTADSWHNPVQTGGGVKSLVSQTEASGGGYVFTNTGGAWPYAVYVYDNMLLLPEDAVIEYELSMTASATSINFYTGGSLPDLYGDAMTDEAAGRKYFKLNSYISSSQIDPGSGDLLKGTYSGSVKVSDIQVPDSHRVDGMIALSAIKIYTVGASGTKLTVNKLRVTAYSEPAELPVSTDPLEKVRPTLIDSAQTDGLASLTGMELYVDGERSAATAMDVKKDNKLIYHTVTSQRVVNYARGYQIDLPLGWQEDYSLGALRSRYTNDHFSLTVTREDQNPYGNTASGWETYRTEWLDRYINSSSYLSANGMTYMRTPSVSTKTLDGYEVRLYDIAITDKTNLAMPYYSIAVIRKTDVYNVFYLMILKGDVPTTSVIDRLVRSFKSVAMKGNPASAQGQFEIKIPSYWNAETKAYYNKLLDQQETDFGFFSASMVERSDGSYSSQRKKIQSEYTRLSTATDYDYGIMPTYSHLMYGSTYHNFPTDMANEFAGGNGFNGKPVLQFTYQFTTNNNSDMYAKNPSFDILRGKHDAQFRKLAKDIKAYGKPVLFRLNNEMDTDWTSYCGMVSLLDTDIFVQTWQRLYNIFEQEGVDNCIWIFNPITPATPYCAWGEALCYMPGDDYVQILGLTNYEMGNESTLTPFKNRYTACYNAFNDYFEAFPWVISEFAAGAGGEKKYDWSRDAWVDTTLGRNADKQAAWVKEMFACLNNKEADENAFCRNIVGAVWFSTNDSAYINGKYYITNYLALDAALTDTLAAFKEGLAG